MKAARAGESIEPRVCPRLCAFIKRAREVGDSGHTIVSFVLGLSPVFKGSDLEIASSWGLRPRLYASACSAGLSMDNTAQCALSELLLVTLLIRRLLEQSLHLLLHLGERFLRARLMYQIFQFIRIGF